MSLDVHDDTLTVWANGRIEPVNYMARELQRRRAQDAEDAAMRERLAQWEALGSYEAVKQAVGYWRNLNAPSRPSFAEALETAFGEYAKRRTSCRGDREIAAFFWEMVREARRASEGI